MRCVVFVAVDNLCRCHHLRELTVLNSGFVRGYDEPFHSVALLRAMAMTMHKRADSLRRLGMVLRGTASDPLHEQLLCSKRVFPLHDFFVAALTANKVTSLSCRVDNPHHLAFLVNSVRQLTSNGVVMPRNTQSSIYTTKLTGIQRQTEKTGPWVLPRCFDSVPSATHCIPLN